MTLIKSISGIRGTIGGPTGDTLNPLDIVKRTVHKVQARLLWAGMRASLARW